MMKFFLSILSLIISLALLAGGIYLSVTETLKNDKLLSDWDDMMNTEWIAPVE